MDKISLEELKKEQDKEKFISLIYEFKSDIEYKLLELINKIKENKD